MRAILAAIDFSPVTESVLAYAATLARSLEGKIVLLHVVMERPYVDEFAPPEKGLAALAAQEAAARARLAAIQRRLVDDERVPTEILVRRGPAAMRILQEAAEHDAAFIVLGSHGHTALFDLILGSTTQAVVKSAEQPIVVIPSRVGPAAAGVAPPAVEKPVGLAN